MRKKLTHLFNYAAAMSFPLIAMAGHRPHPPALPAQPDLPATDISAMLAPSSTPPVGDSLSALLLSMLANTDWKMRALYLFAGIILGGLVGAFFSDRLRRFRRLLVLAAMTLALIVCVLANNPLAFGVGAAVAGYAAFWLLRDRSNFGFEPIFGNAHPANRSEIAAAGHMLAFDAASNSYVGEVGIPLGTLIEQPR
jgi:hypothetical protein